MTWKPGGDTPIGTNLRSKILQPMVYSKLPTKSLERPLLISIITDGMPDADDDPKLADAILECRAMLQEERYNPNSKYASTVSWFLQGWCLHVDNFLFSREVYHRPDRHSQQCHQISGRTEGEE